MRSWRWRAQPVGSTPHLLRAAELATPVTPLGLVGLAPGWRRVGSGLAPGARSALWGSGRAAQGLSSTYAEAEARAPTSAGIGQPELFRARPPLCSLPRLGLRAAGGRGRGNSGGVSRVSNDESRVWSNRVYIALAQHTPLSRVSAQDSAFKY